VTPAAIAGVTLQGLVDTYKIIPGGGSGRIRVPARDEATALAAFHRNWPQIANPLPPTLAGFKGILQYDGYAGYERSPSTTGGARLLLVPCPRLLLRTRHRARGSDRQRGVTRFKALTIADMNSANDAGLERLDQFDTTAGHDFAGRGGDDIDMSDACPDQRQAE